MQINTTDEKTVESILAAVASKYGLQPVVRPRVHQILPRARADRILSYSGGKVGPFTSGMASASLWRLSDPSRLQIMIGAPTSGGTSFLSERIFGEVKATLIERFGPARIRDVTFTAVNPI